MTESVPGRTVSRLKLILLALIFVAPLGSATIYFYWIQIHGGPLHTTNHGHLVRPARPLYRYDSQSKPHSIRALSQAALQPVGGGKASPTLFRGKWTLLMVTQGHCSEACKQRLYDTRQVRAATGQNGWRIQRVLIVAAPSMTASFKAFLHKVHPYLKVFLTRNGKALQEFFRPKPSAAPAGTANRVYLIDPHGNWMMYYRRDDPATGMLKDLQKLLRISTIG